MVLYGSSGNALAMRDLGRTLTPPFEVVAYIDDFRGDQGVSIDGAPIVTLGGWRKRFPDVPCTVSVGDPRARRILAARVSTAGGKFCSPYEIRGWISSDVIVGEGSLIAPSPTYVGPQTVIGDHSQIMQFCIVSHNCTIGDYVTVCPAVNISGYVVVEDDVYIGVGATIVNGTERKPLRIGRGAMVCAGAVVLQSVSAGRKVAGNPAQDLRSVLAGRVRRPHRGDV